jgi:predicted alpha/beta hydrolase family esterase
VAVVPLAPAHSAAPVFCEGVLSAVPDWEVLGRGLGGPGAARERLAELLESTASTLSRPAPREPRRAILVAARGDGFVPSGSTLRLLRHWRGAELRYLPGGHVSAFFTGRPAITQAILDALGRVEPLGPHA